MKILNGQEFIDFLKERIGDKLLSGRVEKKAVGVAKTEYDVAWISVDRNAVVDAVRAMKELDYPLVSVFSAYDAGTELAVVEHFTLFTASKNQGLYVQMEVRAPKDDPWIPSITQEIPGASTTEQEKREMIGVQFKGLPPMDNIFLPQDFPTGVYPWRKDETGIDAHLAKGTGGEDK